MKKFVKRASLLVSLALGVALASGASNASAAEESAGAPAATAPSGPERWYGWQTAIVFGASAVPTIAAAATSQDVLYAVGVPGLLLGGPIVHWAHGHVERGFAVLGLNVGLSVIGGLIGAAAVSGEGDNASLGAKLRGSDGFVLGAGVGALVSNALDIAVFTYEPEQRAEKIGNQSFPFTVTPQVLVSANRTSVGLAGTF